MKKNKSDFVFTLSSIKKSFDIEEFVGRLWEFIDDRLIDLILDTSIYLKEANIIFGGEEYMEIDQVNELKKNIYVDFYDNQKNKVIRNEIYNDIFNGTLLPKISDNFKLELFFQNKNESHYLIYSNFNKKRIYIACKKNLNEDKVDSYIVNFSDKKISKLDFLRDFIQNNSINDKKEKNIFDIPENYFSEETGLQQEDYYYFFVKSNLPKINFKNKNKREALKIIHGDVSAIKDLPENLAKNKNFILELIRLSEFTKLPLYFLEDIYKKDKDIVYEAIKKTGNAFQFAHESLKKDRKFVLKVVEYDGYALKYVDQKLKKDKEVALVAFKDFGTVDYGTGGCLQYLDESLKNDREVVIAALAFNGTALEYASNELKKDKEIVLNAIRNETEAIKFADSSLRNNKQFILDAVRRSSGLILEYLEENLKKDKNFVLEILSLDGWSLRWADKSLMKDKDLVLKAIKLDVRNFGDIDENLAKDKKFILEALKENPKVKDYLSDEFKNDNEIK